MLIKCNNSACATIVDSLSPVAYCPLHIPMVAAAAHPSSADLKSLIKAHTSSLSSSLSSLPGAAAAAAAVGPSGLGDDEIDSFYHRHLKRQYLSQGAPLKLVEQAEFKEIKERLRQLFKGSMTYANPAVRFDKKICQLNKVKNYPEFDQLMRQYLDANWQDYLNISAETRRFFETPDFIKKGVGVILGMFYENNLFSVPLTPSSIISNNFSICMSFAYLNPKDPARLPIILYSLSSLKKARKYGHVMEGDRTSEIFQIFTKLRDYTEGITVKKGSQHHYLVACDPARADYIDILKTEAIGAAEFHRQKTKCAECCLNWEILKYLSDYDVSGGINVGLEFGEDLVSKTLNLQLKKSPYHLPGYPRFQDAVEIKMPDGSKTYVTDWILCDICETEKPTVAALLIAAKATVLKNKVSLSKCAPTVLDRPLSPPVITQLDGFQG